MTTTIIPAHPGFKVLAIDYDKPVAPENIVEHPIIAWKITEEPTLDKNDGETMVSRLPEPITVTEVGDMTANIAIEQPNGLVFATPREFNGRGAWITHLRNTPRQR